MESLMPLVATIYWILGDGAPPNLQGFERIPTLFISLFQMFWPWILFLAFAGMILALLEVAAPGSTKKIIGIFR